MAPIKIDDNICKGCELCISVCPKKILKINKEKLNSKGFCPASITSQELCIECAFCAQMCPETAIEVFKKERK